MIAEEPARYVGAAHTLSLSLERSDCVYQSDDITMVARNLPQWSVSWELWSLILIQ